MLLRTGRVRCRATRACERYHGGFKMPGSSPCLPWIFERKIAVLGSDAVSDVLPTPYEAPLNMPIHT